MICLFFDTSSDLLKVSLIKDNSEDNEDSEEEPVYV